MTNILAQRSQASRSTFTRGRGIRIDASTASLGVQFRPRGRDCHPYVKQQNADNNVLNDFAKRYRVKTRKDECGDWIIPGVLGSIYAHSDCLLGLVLQSPTQDKKCDTKLRKRIKAAIRAGFAVNQMGDVEAVLLFDPADGLRGSLAIRLASIRRTRRSSPAQLSNLRKGSAAKAFLEATALGGECAMVSHDQLKTPLTSASVSGATPFEDGGHSHDER